MIDGVELADGGGDGRVNRHRRLEPDAAHQAAGRLPRVHFHFAAGHRAVAVLGAHRRLFDRDRPHAAAAAQQRAQAVDGIEKVAAVPLHHRQQQVAAGVAAEPRVLEHRQPRQQHAARLARVSRQRERALEDVARRQDAELVAQLPRAPAAVEHRHDGVDVQPGIVLQAAENARHPGAAAKAPDIQLAKTHALHNTHMPEIPAAVRTLDSDLREMFGARVRSVVVYGIHAREAEHRARRRWSCSWPRRRCPARPHAGRRRLARVRRPAHVRGAPDQVARSRAGHAAPAGDPTSSRGRSTCSRSS